MQRSLRMSSVVEAPDILDLGVSFLWRPIKVLCMLIVCPPLCVTERINCKTLQLSGVLASPPPCKLS